MVKGWRVFFGIIVQSSLFLRVCAARFTLEEPSRPNVRARAHTQAGGAGLVKTHLQLHLRYVGGVETNVYSTESESES